MQMRRIYPPKASVYVSQYNLHIPEMPVRQTLNFSARFQGVGNQVEVHYFLNAQHRHN